MLNSIQLLLVRFSAAAGGLEKLECSSGGTDFRNRSGDLSSVACELSEQHLDCGAVPTVRQALSILIRGEEVACTKRHVGPDSYQP